MRALRHNLNRSSENQSEAVQLSFRFAKAGYLLKWEANGNDSLLKNNPKKTNIYSNVQS